MGSFSATVFALRAAVALATAAASMTACGGMDEVRRLSGKHSSQTSADPPLVSEAVGFSETLILGCGPTLTPPADLFAPGLEYFGCAIFGREDKRRVENGMIFQEVRLGADGVFTASAVPVPATSTKVWKAFFALPAGVFAGVRQIEATLVLGEYVVTLRNDGFVVHDPENLTDRDEKENTFILPDEDDLSPKFKRLDGHILFVTRDAMTPGHDFNSLKGADYRCSVDAQRDVKLAVNRWVAVLSDEKTDAVDRIILTGSIFNTKGEKILADSTQLLQATGFSGPLLQPRGDPATNAIRVWTGSASGGKRLTGSTCESWASHSEDHKGETGNPASDDLFGGDQRPCNEERHLYCISQ